MMVLVVFKLLRLTVISLIFLPILFPVNKVSALSSLNESFSEAPLDLEIWNATNNNGVISVGNGMLGLSAPNGTSYPFIYLNNASIYFDGDFSFELKVMFKGPLNFGSGISLTDKLLSNGTVSDPKWEDRIFLLWPSPNGTFSLYSAPCPNTVQTCGNDSFFNSVFTKNWNEWHKVKISRGGNIYSVHLDDVLVFVSKPSSRIVSELWIGNYQRTGGVTWGGMFVDDIMINSNIPNERKVPLLVIPGLGASWDFAAILGGTEGYDWQIPFFVTQYDNLIDSLLGAGYEENNDLFTFAYDWRKPLSSLVEELADYIEGLASSGKVGPEEKFNIVGHSYGGLIARTYSQQKGLDRIHKVITAGSPHEGVVDSYGIWEGATVWKKIWWQRAALEITIKLNQRAGENRVQTLRRLAPAIKDTLPTFDYLKQDSKILPTASISQRNTFIESMDNILDIDGQIWANGGIGFTTLRYLNVTDRDWRDRSLGLWEDGKPNINPFESTIEGDGAVLQLSSIYSFSNSTVLNSDHENIISSKEAIEKIFEQLELDMSKVVNSSPPDGRQTVFVASLRSPGNIHICNLSAVCDSNLGVYLPSEKLFLFPGYNDEELEVKVDAGGETGEYKLYLGRLTEGLASWKDLNGILLSPTQTDEYEAFVQDGRIEVQTPSEVAVRRFDQNITDLNSLAPGWDKKNLMAIARSVSSTVIKRTVAIRQLREILSSLAIKAKKNNKLDQVEVIIRIWQDIDGLAQNVIGSGNSTKIAFLNANIKAVEAYRLLANRLLQNSSSYYAAVFYEMFENRFAEGNALIERARDLSLDKTLSARYLLLTAIGLR